MVKRMTAPELAERLAQRDSNKSSESSDASDTAERFIVLDVREPMELELASLPGAKHIPLGELMTRYLELDPEVPVVVLCHHGIRSFHAASFLKAQDFDVVYNLSGGIDAYSRQVDDSIPTY